MAVILSVWAGVACASTRCLYYELPISQTMVYVLFTHLRVGDSIHFSCWRLMLDASYRKWLVF